MRKIIILLSSVFLLGKAYACADSSMDYSYYNIFSQELIQSPQYYPFLLAYDEAYYSASDKKEERNENIEDWQKKLNISYEDAYYLVFKAPYEEMQKLLKGKGTKDEQLSFVDAQFIKKNKQALLYISYAKYLEPYMLINNTGGWDWSYVDTKKINATALDYAKVISVLTRSWNAETDKDLKIRYGYQLVRFAHYNNNYQEAVEYFNKYVAAVNHRPIMYYYALDQKGGAERALGNYMQANNDFFQFFTQTKNKKQSAYSSMKVTDDLDFEQLLKKAKTNQERNDLYLLLGFRNFTNPLVPLQNIIANNPDAIQAKVLMARAVNTVERNFLETYPSCNASFYYGYDRKCNNTKDNLLPLSMDEEANKFIKEALEVSIKQSEITKDKSYWNLTTAYLYLLQKNFSKAAEYLNKVSTTSEQAYLVQKNYISILLDIAQQDKITAEFENKIGKEYADLLNIDKKNAYGEVNTSAELNGLIINLLANRYFLQGDYAKSFLLQNNLADLEYQPDLKLLEAIEQLYYKQNKNDLEKRILRNTVSYTYDENYNPIENKNFDFDSYIANMRGSVYLKENKLPQALAQFKKVKAGFILRNGENIYYNYKTGEEIKREYDGYSNISKNIFGYNIKECFNCEEDEVMNLKYTENFPLIKDKMNKEELTKSLIELEKVGTSKGELAAKANFLLGNFYFNTSIIGYFRELLTFDMNNSKGEKFHNYNNYSYNRQSKDNFKYFFQGYSWFGQYEDDFSIGLAYLDKGLQQTKNNELKAELFFAASKYEQGNYYKSNDPIIANLRENYWTNSDASERQMMDFKVKNFRNYFKELKNYSSTDFYKEVASNCKYFNYYSSNY